ncbi:hypothetical protein [Sorangium sp. So ce1024]|uniref:hypothetical protein n=1 Tax=unclassified Sorangium TaxID=2621164 RepID=UPI003EFDF892
MEVDELLSEGELLLEPRRALLELGNAPVLRVLLRLATGLALRQSLAAVEGESLAPRRQEGPVGALAAQQRLDVPALGAGGRLANDAQLLRR